MASDEIAAAAKRTSVLLEMGMDCERARLMKDEKTDRTQCSVCGRFVRVDFNYCDKCGIQLADTPAIKHYPNDIPSA